MEQTPSVAIIILNWNGFHDTVACLESLLQTDYASYRVVLVDNGSQNAEGRRLKELFPALHLISNAANRGFAGGCNDGINWALQSGFDYIMTLNNDTLVDKRCLANLIAGVRAARADFASARIMYYPETNLICSDGDVLLPDGTGFAANAHRRYSGGQATRPIFSACAAAALFSRESLEAVKIKKNQFFDELFFAYLEDVDLCARLHAKSYKGASIGDAVVYHKESNTAGPRSLFQITQMEKNRMLVELLNFPLWLIPVGEAYYCIKTLLGMFGKKKICREGAAPVKSFNPWGVLLRSRKWILEHATDIYKDRKERSARAMIDGKIYRHLCWDMSRLWGGQQ